MTTNIVFDPTTSISTGASLGNVPLLIGFQAIDLSLTAYNDIINNVLAECQTQNVNSGNVADYRPIQIEVEPNLNPIFTYQWYAVLQDFNQNAVPLTRVVLPSNY